MPNYDAIDIGLPFKASQSDLVAFKWATNGITADFVLHDDPSHLLRVSFNKQCIVRLLDEMPLSTEEDDSSNEGLVPDQFAYRLKGAAFARAQSRAWQMVVGTGWACMDVLSAGSPSFTLIERTANEDGLEA